MLHWLHIHQTPLLELKSDAWIRILAFPSDLLVLPAGIYHRFTPDESNAIKALCLFKVREKPGLTFFRTRVLVLVLVPRTAHGHYTITLPSNGSMTRAVLSKMFRGGDI
ncbi:uncharacterized protein EI90DRAFT_325782 [Cantharellus anzutake]|uniref:uncharacterized protein n=1 Tax=Cantharellus anzutake TaxID=1750568 RepID=UPI001907F98F|nr:uncharacterized protein EI90DRAFT_325782 [Cantharellus anzutake]KAF8335391.1 hypothetical protein EI90DRAFT_325782 [Cantharellus anzutake]